MTTHDPIVAEVRAARTKLMKECGYDLDRFVERMLEYQAKHPERLLTKEQLDARRAHCHVGSDLTRRRGGDA